MTLLEIIRAIERVAAAQPSVNMIVENDVDKLNGEPSALYGVFGFTQQTHEVEVEGDFVRYHFFLWYVDRITETHGNQLEVQSVGIETLTNILTTLDDEGISSTTATMETVDEQFADMCAGVFTDVTFEVLKGSRCPSDFPEQSDIKII